MLIFNMVFETLIHNFRLFIKIYTVYTANETLFVHIVFLLFFLVSYLCEIINDNTLDYLYSKYDNYHHVGELKYHFEVIFKTFWLKIFIFFKKYI